MVPRYEKIIHMNSLMDRNYLILVYIPEIYDTALTYQQLKKVIVTLDPNDEIPLFSDI